MLPLYLSLSRLFSATLARFCTLLTPGSVKDTLEPLQNEVSITATFAFSVPCQHYLALSRAPVQYWTFS